jgi:hypothetical protein
LTPLGVSGKPGCPGASCAWGIYRRDWPRRSGNWSLQCFNAHEPPRSTRCSGNASTTGASKPGIWAQAAYCIRPPQGEWREVSNASPSCGRTRRVASRARGDPPTACGGLTIVAGAALYKRSTPGCGGFRQALAAPQGVGPNSGHCFATRSPLQPLRHPRGVSRDFCHPGVRFLQSFVE